jgi:multiple sugar transport system substrate-binding protein
MGEEGKKIAEMARRFERANPGVTVETQAIPWEAAHAKLLTAVVGGIPPDVSQIGTTWMAEFATMGALEPLDHRAAESPTANPTTPCVRTKSINPASWPFITPTGAPILLLCKSI